MIFTIISTTDGKFLGEEFNDSFPILLGEIEFNPTNKLIIEQGIYRYYNSNYSIDVVEKKD